MTPCNLVCCTRFWSNVLLPHSLFFLTLDICVCIYIYIYTQTHTHTQQTKRSRNHIFTVMQRHSCSGALSQICGNRIVALSCLSVCPSAWNTLAPAGGIFMKFYIGEYFAGKIEKNSVSVIIWQKYQTLFEDVSIPMTGLVTSGIMVGIDIIGNDNNRYYSAPFLNVIFMMCYQGTKAYRRNA
jgi:hypothetical protein